jgi:hypothetical protein
MKFSYYKSGIKQIIPTKKADIKEISEYIRIDEMLLSKTFKLRSIDDKEARIKFKASLPYCTFSGIFSTRSNDKLIEHSGYICCDLDHIGTNGEIKKTEKEILQYYTPALMFVSPSGDGLKVVFSIDINKGTHLQYFIALETFFKMQFSLPVDAQCKDVSRACFLCHDPDAFVSDSPDTLDQDFISKGIPKFQIDETNSYEAAKKWTDTKITFIEGNRNKYIYTLADTCIRFGIPEQVALNNMQEFAASDFTIKEIETTVKSRYSYKERFGIASTSTDVKDIPYIRVGCDYFKVIHKKDRYGIVRRDLKRWTKDTIVIDHKRKYLQHIPKYDDFIMAPDNINYQPVINNCYNHFAPFCHTPAPGPWIWTDRLLHHIFGEQYLLGIRYMQILYCYPRWATVILAIVSKIQKTGKTTFINWICMLFGSNAAVISSSDFGSIFNGHYATKNLVVIEETLFDKKLTIEKLKALATQKQLSVNRKNIDQFNLEFFGKIILTSNFEDKFAQVNPEETRFFVRKVGIPEFTNLTIEKNLLEEIPAFLYYLKGLPPLSDDIDRSGFTSAELINENLKNVMDESHSGLYKDIEILVAEYFNTHNIDSFKAAAVDVKKQFFSYDNSIPVNYIRRILDKEFEMEILENQRYTPFEEDTGMTKTGTPFEFKKEDFVKNVKNLNEELTPF